MIRTSFALSIIRSIADRTTTHSGIPLIHQLSLCLCRNVILDSTRFDDFPLSFFAVFIVCSCYSHSLFCSFMYLSMASFLLLYKHNANG